MPRVNLSPLFSALLALSAPADAQFFMPGIRGALIAAVILSVALFLFSALMVSAPVLLLQWLYRRAVLRWMNTRGGAGREEERAATPGPAHAAPADLHIEVRDARAPAGSPADDLPLYGRAVRSSRALARVYAAAGLAYVAALIPIMLGQSLYAGRIALNVKTAGFIAMFAALLLWLPLLMYLTVAVAGRLRKALLLAGYVVLLVATSAAFSSGESVTLWPFLMGPPTSILVITRRAGVAGLLSAAVLLLLLLGAALSFAALSLFPQTQKAGEPSGYLLASAQLLTLPLVLVLTVALGALLLVLAGRRYERKKMSDLTLALDCFMLFTTVWVTAFFGARAGWYAAAVALSFPVYKLVALAGLRRLRRREAWDGGRGVSLMLLRVFGAKRSSEWLMSHLSYYWRYAGSIQLIAAPDLAGANLELHELMHFVTGRVKNQFIKDAADRERQLAALDLAPDPDGRHRVNEFFCLNDVWHGTVAELLERSDAVLMDLRGFTPSNEGCVAELGELVNLVPVNRLVITANENTDYHFLYDALYHAWARMGPDSPNRALRRPTLRILNISAIRQDALAVKRLLSMLGEAARSEAGRGAPALTAAAAPAGAGLQA